MPSEESVPAPHSAARFAGAIYAIVVVTGVFGLAYAPARVFAGDSDAAVVQSIVANEGLLRLAIVAELACYVAFIALPLALHRLLAPWGVFSATLMAALAIVSAPLGFANVQHLLEIVRLVDGGDGAAMLAARARYESGLLVQSVPWGLWLIPLGALLIRSGFFPRLLAVLLIARGAGYIVDLVGRVLAEDAYLATGLARVFSTLGLAEMVTCLWLLVFGARRSFLPRGRTS